MAGVKVEALNDLNFGEALGSKKKGTSFTLTEDQARYEAANGNVKILDKEVAKEAKAGEATVGLNEQDADKKK